MTDEQLAAEAAKAASVSNDGTSVTRRSLADQIAYEKFRRANEAAQQGGLPFRISQIVPSGGAR